MTASLRHLKDKLIAKLFTQFPWLFRQWTKHSTFVRFKDIPWVPLKREISKSKLALITTGGVHVKSHPPFGMLDPNGDPTFREISSNCSVEDLIITHNYYDHSDADKDINIVFPIERIWELKESGEIGEINHRHFSFMGHIREQHIDMLINSTAPVIVQYLKEDSVDIVILSPS